ncbi:MAG: hypothetical protein M3400_05650 [Actinomycetota bacterium]|nr:hypothetical protein [Actinomycetota bacterium]
MLIALCSAKGSPGVTTSALALAWGWPRRMVLAECDPAGGDILAGYGQGQARLGSQGLTDLMVAARNGSAELELWTHLVSLDPQRKSFVLPGLSEPRSAGVIDWPRLVSLLVGSGADILADCGRLRAENVPRPVLWAADLVLLVCRARLRSVRAAQTAAVDLASELASRGTGADALGVVLVDPGTPFTVSEVEQALRLPVVATLPGDERSAAVFSDGAPAARTFTAAPLVKAGQHAAEQISALAQARMTRLGISPQGSATGRHSGDQSAAAPKSGPGRLLSPAAVTGAWDEAIAPARPVAQQPPRRWRDPAPLHGPGERR